MAQQLQFFKVSRVYFSISGDTRDPHVPDTAQFHHAIFIQTRSSGHGFIYHVIGDVTSAGGMRYEKRLRSNVAESQTFHHQEVLGYLPAAALPEIDAVLQSRPTPPQQKAYKAKRNATEPFQTKSPLTFYTSNELKSFQFPRLQKCKWWVETQALPALQQSGRLIKNPPHP